MSKQEIITEQVKKTPEEEMFSVGLGIDPDTGKLRISRIRDCYGPLRHEEPTMEMGGDGQ